MSYIEQTLSIIKPDAVKRGLTGEINTLIEKNKMRIVAQKMLHLSLVDAKGFYFVHKERAFFNDLCEYLSSGPIVVIILERENAVLNNRELMGATNPKDAKEGTIRKKYGISIDKNSVHGSDSLENAKIEIEFFFKD